MQRQIACPFFSKAVRSPYKSPTIAVPSRMCYGPSQEEGRPSLCGTVVSYIRGEPL